MSPQLCQALGQRGVSCVISRDATEQARRLADRVADDMRAALQARGHARVALSGGRSPVPFLQALACSVLDWRKVSLTLVDERWVAADQLQSNARLLQEQLGACFEQLDWLPMYRGQSPQQDATNADSQLSRWLPLDVVVLGMGLDGHTASLFPGNDGLADWLRADSDALCVVSHAADDSIRLTMTGRALHSARRQLLAISGEDKAAVLQAALNGDMLEWPIAAFLQSPLEIHYCPNGT